MSFSILMYFDTSQFTRHSPETDPELRTTPKQKINHAERIPTDVAQSVAPFSLMAGAASIDQYWGKAWVNTRSASVSVDSLTGIRSLAPDFPNVKIGFLVVLFSLALRRNYLPFKLKALCP